MSPWGKICRICASPADYEIFANIPIYLHASCKEYLDWQKPINEMIEETTGLKVSFDDGLPKNICALCISYLKHAKTFREQAINTCLNFLAVNEYKNIVNDKEVLNYDKIIDDVATTTQRNNYEDDNLKNNQSKEQNKVSKTLMSNTSLISTPTLSRQVQLSLKYLTQLYDNNVNAETNTNNLVKRSNGAQKPTGTKHRRHYNKSFDVTKPTTSGSNSQRHNLEDDLPRTTSSDEYETPEEAGAGYYKNNIFSYKEKNFEEDDIMDLDELKDAITINIPSTCKEHKCTFCFKRFMFEESFGDHIRTCIEYKFATFLEEMNNLLYIRRAKEISPHEFIRRMIFSLRKTCEWLRDNCIDATLPDLLQSNQTNETVLNKQRLESESKSTASSTEDQQSQIIQHNKLNKTLLVTPPLISTRATALLQSNQANETVLNKQRLERESKSTASYTEDQQSQNIQHNKLNKTLLVTSSPISTRPTIGRNTPINISNNILYEIERSESRNSQKMIVKKPIAILGTANVNKTANNLLENENEKSLSQDLERLAFMEKLQKAAKPIADEILITTSTKVSTPIKSSLQLKTNIPNTPLISVRQDLLPTPSTPNTKQSFSLTSPLLDLLQSPYSCNSTSPVCNPCARCPQCNLYFKTLDALEIHNATQHNSITTISPKHTTQANDELDSEHKRIIALFEDEDEI